MTGEVLAVLMDANRTIIDASAPARAILDGDGVLRRSFGRLSARNGSDGLRLDSAVRDAIANGMASLSIGESGDALTIDLARMRQADGTLCLVAMLTPARQNPVQSVAGAVRRFGLTGAEARLLAILFEGCSLPQAAARLGVARSTVRTHLQRLFDKTGARRQAELVRTVALAA